MDGRLLGIYLNDHLAGALAGVELVQRSRNNNRRSEFGGELDRLLRQVREDRQTLGSVMASLHVSASPAKGAAAWFLEKLLRLKLNGRLLNYSPLSRVVELEGLSAGVEAKRLLWKALDRVAESDRRLHEFDFGSLIRRAERQRATLERLRLKALGLAFGLPTPGSRKPQKPPA